MRFKLPAMFVVVCLLVSIIFVGQVEAKPPWLRGEDGYGYKYEYYEYYEEKDGYGYEYEYYEEEESVEKDVYEEDVYEGKC